LAGNSVEFKANANGLVVVFDKDEPFDSICRQLSKRLESGGFFFQTRYLAVTYKGRKLTGEEEGVISRLMAEMTGARTVLFEIDKEFLRNGAGEASGNDDEQERHNVIAPERRGGEHARMDEGGTGFTRPPAVQRRRQAPVDLDECVTRYFRGTLRSGRLISYDGNVVVIGDVNPGAEVEATGNIIILGNVRGIVHAGAGGNKEASVIALNFEPTQLRIADIVTRRIAKRNNAKNLYTPEIAYLRDDTIVVDPLSRHAEPAARMPAR